MSKFMKIWLTLLLLAPLAARLDAQPVPTEELTTTLPDADAYPFSVYLLMPLTPLEIFLDVGYRNMYQLLRNNGVLTSRNDLFIEDLISFGVGGRWKRSYLDLKLAFSPSKRDLYFNKDYEVFNSYTIASINLGYAVWQDRNYSMLLRGGIGGAFRDIELFQKSSSPTLNFNNFTSPVSTVAWSLKHSALIGDVGIEWQVGRPKRNISASQWIRLGYRFGLNDQTWEAQTTAANAPTDRPRQWYISGHMSISNNFKPRKKRQ